MRFSSYSLNTQLLQPVDEGLSKVPKTLPSWMFYNDEGNRLFQAIMHMREYYPTTCEYEILQTSRDTLRHYVRCFSGPFQLVELGAGDGVKTQLLLEHLASNQIEFEYVPVDVSVEVLQILEKRLKRVLPQIPVRPRGLRYEESLGLLKKSALPKLILFLGANIGNYPREEATQFMSQLFECMSDHDLLLIGFDLKKDPGIIHRAYDDPNGITKAFNLNLLTRINQELGGDFHLGNFDHFASYDPHSGEARSYIISRRKQQVYIDALSKTFPFGAWEAVHTEVSQKYDLRMIETLMRSAGFEMVEMFFDSRKYFCDVLMRKK